MSAILKVNESYIALRHRIQFNHPESKSFQDPAQICLIQAEDSVIPLEIRRLVILIMYSIA